MEHEALELASALEGLLVLARQPSVWFSLVVEPLVPKIPAQGLEEGPVLIFVDHGIEELDGQVIQVLERLRGQQIVPQPLMDARLQRFRGPGAYRGEDRG